MNSFAGFLAVLSAAGILLPAFSAECFQLDPGGRKKLFYYAEHEIGRGDPDAEYAVVWIHGMHGASADAARLLRKKLSGMENGDKVYCIAPSFAESKLLKNPAMRDKTLLWDRENWRGGGKSSNGPGISSFTVIDLICGKLADRKRYPPDPAYPDSRIFRRRTVCQPVCRSRQAAGGGRSPLFLCGRGAVNLSLYRYPPFYRRFFQAAGQTRQKFQSVEERTG